MCSTRIGGMASPAVEHADTLLTEGYSALRAAGGANASDTDLLEIARVSNRAVRVGEQVLVATVAELNRRGAFTALGQRTVHGLADLLGVEPRTPGGWSSPRTTSDPGWTCRANNCRRCCPPPPRCSRPGGPASRTCR